MSNIENQKLLDEIDSGKNIIEMSIGEMKMLQKPIGKATYNSAKGRPRKQIKVNWNDKIKCSVCGELYTRSNSSRHKKTKIHQVYETLNKKLVKILLEN